MKKPAKPKRFETFIKTTDQWFPNYPGNKVKVHVYDITEFTPDGVFSIIIGVWGDDDDGMSKQEDFETIKERNKAFKQWVREIKTWRVVTKAELKRLKFENG